MKNFISNPVTITCAREYVLHEKRKNIYCKPKPRMCGVGRFLFHKGFKFLGRVSSFFITLPVQHPGGVGTLSSQRDFRGHIPALAASAED